MSEGRKPKLNWVKEFGGIWTAKEARGMMYVATAKGSGLHFGFAHDGFTGKKLFDGGTLEEAQLACEDWLEKECQPYLAAARALGMLEEEEPKLPKPPQTEEQQEQ
jgi:hypothetical protein